jgi:acetyltransferase
MQRIFYPHSIVVIGVSEKPDNLAQHIVGNLKTFGYQGEIYAVGRQPGLVHDIPIVTSLDQVPDGLDLAVILTPAFLVPELIETCGRKRIHRAVIESGGFSEFSEEGRRLEERVLEIARQHGIRFVGPNCISVVNLENGVCLPFTPLTADGARLGPASVVAQSGGVSIAYLHRLCASGVGGNKAVSIGNKTDLNEADYVRFLIDDPGTEIILLYLESIDQGRRLMDLAISTSKAVICHKANRGQASQSVAFSHTAALANDDRIVSGALRQAGIARAEGFRDAVAIAQGLALPPVHGNDLVVISRSGGHAVVAADYAERYGFRLNPLPQDFAAAVRAMFPADVITPTNPIDLGVIFDFDLYAQVVESCLRALSPDAILLINTYGSAEAEGAHRLARRVDAIARETGRPIAYCAQSRADDREILQAELRMPVFYEIEEALRGLAASRDRQGWLARRRGRTPDVPSVVRPASLPALSGPLTADQALSLCEQFGIPPARWMTAADAKEAGRCAASIGFPVALKIVSADIVHKSDVGGVTLGLQAQPSVELEAEAMLQRVGKGGARSDRPSLLVQQMVSGGTEMILGGQRDPSFGPVVMVGLGGVFVEALKQVAFRVAPLTRIDAEEMIDEIPASRILSGFRGIRPADREALVDAIINFSQCLADNPRISEMEINPLMVLEKGVVALDARAVIRE